MNFVLHKLVRTFEQLSSKDNDGGGTITNLTVLNLRKFDENLSSGVSYFKLFQDSGAIIGDSDIADVVNKHLIETLWS